MDTPETEQKLIVDSIIKNNILHGLPQALTTLGYNLRGDQINYESKKMTDLIEVLSMVKPDKINMKCTVKLLLDPLQNLIENYLEEGEIIAAMKLNDIPVERVDKIFRFGLSNASIKYLVKESNT